MGMGDGVKEGELRTIGEIYLDYYGNVAVKVAEGITVSEMCHYLKYAVMGFEAMIDKGLGDKQGGE